MGWMHPDERKRDLKSLREQLRKPMSDYYTSTPSIQKRVAKSMHKTHEAAEMLGRDKPYGEK